MFFAFRTDALDDVVHGGHLIAVGQGDEGHFGIVEAESAMALLAIEVWVLVVVDVVVVAAAQFVAHAVASVFDDMHQVLLAEGSERAEHVRLVDAQYFVFELGER